MQPAAAFAKEPAEVADAEESPSIAEAVKETIEELRFYLAHSMPEQARVVFAKLEKLKPGAEHLASIWQEIEAADRTADSKQAQAVEEVGQHDQRDAQHQVARSD